MNGAGNIQSEETAAINPALVKSHNNTEREILSPKTKLQFDAGAELLGLNSWIFA